MSQKPMLRGEVGARVRVVLRHQDSALLLCTHVGLAHPRRGSFPGQLSQSVAPTREKAVASGDNFPGEV